MTTMYIYIYTNIRSWGTAIGACPSEWPWEASLSAKFPACKLFHASAQPLDVWVEHQFYACTFLRVAWWRILRTHPRLMGSWDILEYYGILMHLLTPVYVILCHIIFWIFILQKSNCPCEMKSHFSYSFLTFSLRCPKNPSLTGAWFIAEDLPKPFDVKGVGKAQRIELRIATSEPIQKNIQRFCSMLRMLVVFQRDTHTKRLSIETSPVPWCIELNHDPLAWPIDFIIFQQWMPYLRRLVKHLNSGILAIKMPTKPPRLAGFGKKGMDLLLLAWRATAAVRPVKASLPSGRNIDALVGNPNLNIARLYQSGLDHQITPKCDTTTVPYWHILTMWGRKKWFHVIIWDHDLFSWNASLILGLTTQYSSYSSETFNSMLPVVLLQHVESFLPWHPAELNRSSRSNQNLHQDTEPQNELPSCFSGTALTTASKNGHFSWRFRAGDWWGSSNTLHSLFS